MVNRLMLAALVSVSLAHAGDSVCIQQREMNVSPALIRYQDNNWVMTLEGYDFVIAKHNVDKILRDIPADKVGEVMQHVATRVIQNSSGEFMLQAHVKGLGGGPIAAGIAYKTTFVAGWAAYTTACFYHPFLVAELPPAVAGAMIETAAVAASVAAFALPTP